MASESPPSSVDPLDSLVAKSVFLWNNGHKHLIHELVGQSMKQDCLCSGEFKCRYHRPVDELESLPTTEPPSPADESGNTLSKKLITGFCSDSSIPLVGVTLYCSVLFLVKFMSFTF